MKLFQSMLKVFWRKAGKSPPHKTDVNEPDDWHTQQKKSQYQNKVIIVIPPKFESNVHVSHARAKAQSAAAS